jgi:hypothetical protein
MLLIQLLSKQLFLICTASSPMKVIGKAPYQLGPIVSLECIQDYHLCAVLYWIGTICVLCRDIDIGIWVKSFDHHQLAPNILTIVKDKKDIERRHGNHTYRLVDSWYDLHLGIVCEGGMNTRDIVLTKEKEREK